MYFDTVNRGWLLESQNNNIMYRNKPIENVNKSYTQPALTVVSNLAFLLNVLISTEKYTQRLKELYFKE